MPTSHDHLRRSGLRLLDRDRLRTPSARGSRCRRRLIATVSALTVAVASFAAWTSGPLPAQAEPSPKAAATTSPAATDDLPAFLAVPGAKLAHPGVAQNATQLQKIRDHVRAGDEPWATYYKLFAASSPASKDYVIANDADPGSTTLTAKYGYANYNTGFFNNQMTADANAAYDQAVMYYLTGDVAYRAKAMRIVRLWSLLDPTQAKAVVDAHIQQGPPMYMMNAAADLLRSTASTQDDLAWTDADQQAYVTNFVEPPMRLYMHQNAYFFNQQQTAIMASMSSFVVMDDAAGYAEQVEWFTVNASTPAANAYSNGSLSNALFDVDTDASGVKLSHERVVVKEMMRDQPHSSGNLQGISTIARMVEAQGTQVDPTKGTVSTARNAVGPWEFMGDRILKAANQWARYNLGHLTPYNDGRNTPVSDYARGRAYVYPEIYYHYRYVAGYRDSDPDLTYVAQGFHRAGPIVDVSWLSIPDQAAAMKPSTVTAEPGGAGPYELERRFTALDDQSRIQTSDGVGYVAATSSPQGARFAVTDFYSWRASSLALRVRTTAITTVELRRDAGTAPIRTVTLPDTDGQWRYVTFSLADLPAAAFPTDFQIMFFSVVGRGSRVDLAHLLVSSPDLSPPTFVGGRSRLSVAAWAGEQLAVDVAAKDADADDTVSYTLTGAPAGATVTAGGVLRWAPSTAGSTAFWVSATDGTVVTMLRVEVAVAASYAAAVTAVGDGHDAGQYTKASFAGYAAAAAAAGAATGDDQQPALAALQTAVDGLELLDPRLADGTLDYAADVTTTPSRVSAANLVDGDLTSFTTDLWIADDKSMQLDFGADFRVSATEFRLAPRSGFTARTAGTVVFGSDDQVSWTRLTDPAIDTPALQSLPVQSGQQGKTFRFLRFKDLDSGVSNREQVVEDQPLSLSEIRIVGHRSEVVAALSSVQLSSTGDTPGRAATGDTVTLGFTATEDISDVAVTLLGETTPATQGADHRWTVRREVTDDSTPGPARFTIDYRTAAGTPASTALFTTDQSTVLVSPSKDALDDAPTQAAVTVSSGTFGHGSATDLFDAKADSYTEYTANGSGAGAFLTFDFGAKDAATKVRLSAVELLARQSFASRAAGTTVQGSNDLSTWATLTSGAAETSSWQRIPVLGAQQSAAFRYVRLTNSGTWYGNLAELRLFGERGDDLAGAPAPTSTVSVAVDGDQGGAVSLGAGDTAVSGTTELTGVATGTLVTAKAEPADGYVFSGWTQRKTVEGLAVDVNVSGWPVYNPGYFTGGYLGGSRVNAVIEDTALTAHFTKEVSGSTASAPTKVSVTARDGAADIRWSAPASDGREDVTGYLVTSFPGVAGCVTTGATSCHLEGLVDGTAYTFAVSAKNAAGYGVPSFPAAATPYPAASADSTSVAVSATSGRLGTRVWIRVRVTNKEKTASQVRVDTRLGSRTVKRLGPGASTSLTFVGKLSELPASFATVTAAARGTSLDTGTVSQAGYGVVFPRGS